MVTVKCQTSSRFSYKCYHHIGINQDKTSIWLPFSFLTFHNRLQKYLIWSYPEEKEELKHDASYAVEKIEAWKAHILRATHQDMAKDDVLQGMTSYQGLIIMDWAMKFLPMKFRESQGEWFGKKGRSWHVTAVITRSEDDFEVKIPMKLLTKNRLLNNSFS